MKKLHILHLGNGNVGQEVIRQIEDQKGKIKHDLGIVLEYEGVFNSKSSDKEIKNAIRNVALPFVLIDTTASELTIPYIYAALRCRGFAVLANKKPLAGEQKLFDQLHKIGGERLFYECVVCAGLPVIQPLKNLIATGDEIIEIQGCFSGTLGFLFSQLDAGKSFSEAVIEAKEKGFTEPDPRDDLSGIDVARKALILARLLGGKLELKDIKLKGLYPEEMQKLSVESFLNDVSKLDKFYKEKAEYAKQKSKVLRFVAKVNPKQCEVGLDEVDKSSDIGNLQGPDNIILIKSKRYFNNPLIIKGPGAGIEVTAAGVFANILDVAKIIQGGNI